MKRITLSPAAAAIASSGAELAAESARWRRRWGILIIVNALLMAWLAFKPGPRGIVVGISDLTQVLFPVIGLWWALRACLGQLAAGASLGELTRRPRWRSCALMTAAVAAFAGGACLYHYYEMVLHRSAFPSIADAAFLAAYPLLILGTLALVSGRWSRLRRGRVLMDSVITVLLMATIAWYFLLCPIMTGASRSLLEKFLLTAYPVGDLLVLLSLLLATATVRDRPLKRAVAPIAMGLVMVVVVDTVFAYRSMHGPYEFGGLVDMLWPMGFMLIGLGASALPGLPAVDALESSEEPPEMSMWRSMLPYVALAILGALLIYADVVPDDDVAEYGADGGAALAVAAVLLRQVLAIRENARLNHQLRQTLASLEIANKTLRESEERFRLAADCCSDMIYECDVATGVVRHSTDISLRLGYAPREFDPGTESWLASIHSDDRDRVLRAMEAHLRGDQPFDCEYRILRKDGSAAYWNDRAVAVRDDSGRPVRIIGATTDITARKESEIAMRQARETAEAASLTKSLFLANMSHEIRTPMTAILGYAELLMDPGQSPEERANCAGTIRRNGEYLLCVLNDVLDISKIEAGKLTVERIECSAAQIVSEVAGLMRRRAEDKNIEFEVKYRGLVPEMVRTDPTRLRQILINLIGNAVKFTERGSVHVEVSIEHGEESVKMLRIDVTDTGIGLSEPELQRVFDPFVQADVSTTRRFGGSGLGLSISRRLAQMLGGGISIQSTVASGSTFSATVEVGDLAGVRMVCPVEQMAAPAELKPAPMRLAGRILLAEDGLDNQRLIAHHLRGAGAEVDLAENGQEAFEKALAAYASGRVYDLILMDMQMPVLDGYGATRRLRERKYDGLIVALTAHAMEGEREKCLAAGCDEFLTKPIQRDILLRTIARHLALKAGAAPGQRAA